MSTTITVGATTITPALVEGYEVTRKSGNLVHVIPGREDPDATLRPATLRTGSLSLLFNSEVAAWLAHDALSLGEVCALTSTDLSGIAMSFVIDEDSDITITLDPDTRRQWHVAFSFQEVDV